MEKRWNFLPSVRYKKVLKEEVRNDPLKCFMEWNFVEIRQACLKKMQDFEIGYYHADWAEECIKSLRKSRNYEDLTLAEDVLSWYVFRARQDDLAVRAIEFAISLTEKDTLSVNKVSKIVAGRLKEDISLYNLVPSLKLFLCKLLGHTTNFRHGNWHGKEYFGSDWHMSERAQRIIQAAGDFSFLWKIDEVIMLLEEGCIYPWSYNPPDTKDMHLARLRITRKYLRKAEKEAKKDTGDALCHLAGSFFMNPA